MRNIILLFCFMLASSFAIGQIKVVASGNVGIGTTTPAEQLDVDGGVKIGTTATANAGTIRFNGNCFEGYDGTSWVALGGSGCSGGPSCTDGIQNQGETGVDCGGPCAPCGGGGGCESFADIDADRDLPNTGWNNQYYTGGTGFAGDGELCFTVNTVTGNTRQVLGLDDNPGANAGKTSIQFGIELYVRVPNGLYRYRVLENGSAVTSYMNSAGLFNNETFCIKRTGTTVEYLFEGTVFHTSSVSSTTSLQFDNSFYDLPSNGIWGLRPSRALITQIEVCDNAPAPLQGEQQDEEMKEASFFNPDDVLFDPIFVELVKEGKAAISQSYPNPTLDEASISYSLPSNFNKASVTFTSVMGEQIKEVDLENQKGQLSIDTTRLEPGVYLYTLTVDNKVIATKKLIVANK